MSEKKVTIIIPGYNHAQFLSEAIESALAQTVPCQVIYIDDGSTDNSLEIAWSYVSKVNVIAQVNKGLASARNTGIMWAHGDYVLPLDADDILEPNCVERILQVAEETNADVIAPSIKCFGLGTDTTILMQDPKLEDFKAGNRIPYCSAIKLRALLDVGGYSPRMVEGYEDLHLWINLLSIGKRIVTIPEPLVLYRIKEQSMITEAKKHHDKLMGQIYKDFPNFQHA